MKPIQEEYTEETPLTILIAKEEINDAKSYDEAYRECSKLFLRVMKVSTEFIIDSPSPDLAALAVGYVLNTSINHQSMRKRAESLGYSHNSISRYAREYKKLLKTI